MIDNRFTVPIKPTIRQSLDVSIIILASGYNSRMRSYGCVSLMMVDKYHNVLDAQVNAINSIYPKSDIIITSNSDSRELAFKKPKNVRLIEVSEDAGEMSELRLALNVSISSTVVVIDGNTIFDSNSLKNIRNRGSCTLVKDGDASHESLGVTTDCRKVEYIAYGIPNPWCRITVFTGRELDMLSKYCMKKNKSNLCLFECMNNITMNGGTFSYVSNQGYTRRISSPKDII